MVTKCIKEDTGFCIALVRVEDRNKYIDQVYEIMSYVEITDWNKLEDGLPNALMGKIGVAVSRANSKVVYAIIESDEGGLYKSEDAGDSWTLVNEDRVLRARSWYYMHIYTDPYDEHLVYVLTAPMMKSVDGGKTFTNISVPHGDNHSSGLTQKTRIS